MHKVILALMPSGCPFEDLDDGEYSLKLCIAGADCCQEENDSAIIFTAGFTRESNEEAIKVAKRVAKRIGCFLDLDYFDGSFVHYDKDLDSE